MILALETGSDLASVALLESLEVVAEYAFRHRMSLSRDLMPRVDALMADGMTERAAIRTAAAEAGMHPMRVKRLVVLFPEA